MNLDKVDDKTKEIINESATRNIKLALIFAEISKLENISVTDEEIDAVFSSMSASQNVPENPYQYGSPVTHKTV